MFPSRAEIRTALGASLRLFLNDASALRDFSRTVDGFWKSFFALVLAWPADIYSASFMEPFVRFENPIAMAVRHGMILIVAWLAYAAVVMAVCAAMGKSNRYLTYMVPSNWIAVPITWLFALVSILEYQVGVSEMVLFVVGMLVMIVSIRAMWFTARFALAVTPWQAAGVVLATFIFTYFLWEVLLAVVYIPT